MVQTTRSLATTERPADDILDGMRGNPKRLPCRLLYDEHGAKLFEQICTLDAYYPTRTEIALLRANLMTIAHHVGPHARVIEPGSGEGIKTRELLHALESPSSYVPIDVSREQLVRTAAALRALHTGLDVQPVVADYTQPFELPTPQHDWKNTLVFFPGSTIGNFEPSEAREFLARFATLAGPHGLLLLGADATRDPSTLLRAYDDELGVTAAFDKNVLAHVNRIHDGTFELDAFEHRAVWNARASRVEMHLVSTRQQLVRLGHDVVSLRAGESIITEHCYKHAPHAMQALLASAGWRCRQIFTATDYPMRLWLCEVA
jgi:dimethylhistidine N-methyltransferase